MIKAFLLDQLFGCFLKRNSVGLAEDMKGGRQRHSSRRNSHTRTVGCWSTQGPKLNMRQDNFSIKV